MGAATSSLVLLLLLLSFGPFPTSASRQKTWCVAKPSSDEPTLLANVNYACSQVDCGVLRKGCSCFYPDNLMNHASVAMNLYYQAKGRNKWNCDFRNSGLIVVTDPSYNNCLCLAYRGQTGHFSSTMNFRSSVYVTCLMLI